MSTISDLEKYNEDIGLNELADRVKMNTAYLSVLFKSEVGMSYVKFLTKLRMDKAKGLLKKGYKVYEVSEMVGYNNYRYFTDIFKKYTGETPKTIRIMYSGNPCKKRWKGTTSRLSSDSWKTGKIEKDMLEKRTK